MGSDTDCFRPDATNHTDPTTVFNRLADNVSKLQTVALQRPIGVNDTRPFTLGRPASVLIAQDTVQLPLGIVNPFGIETDNYLLFLGGLGHFPGALRCKF